MDKQEFIEYQTCWNLTPDEAVCLFEAAAGRNAEKISREDYLLAAWDFYFGMDEAHPGPGAYFWGKVKIKSHLAF